MESVDTTEMTVNGLSYREYFQLHGCLPDEVIEDLIGQLRTKKKIV